MTEEAFLFLIYYIIEYIPYIRYNPRKALQDR